MQEARHKVSHLAALVGGQVEGDADREIYGICDLRDAGENDLSFFGNKKYLNAALATKAGAIFVPANSEEKFPTTTIRVENPSKAFAIAAKLFAPEPIVWPPLVHPTAIIAPDAKIGEAVHIGPHVVVERGVSIGDHTHIGAGCYLGHKVKVGAGSFLHPRVVVEERCLIGDRVIIHAGTVIGSDGFGYDFAKDHYEKIPQLGIVQIDNDVELGANVTIDRGRFDKTWIQEGCKIDNLVMIAHNVVVGKHTVIVAQCGISGSTRLGAYVTMAGQSGIVGHLDIGDRVTITAQTGISKDCDAGVIYAGRHARPIKEMMKIEACTHRLPELYDRVRKIERKLDQDDSVNNKTT